jgi:hypothetical protein
VLYTYTCICISEDTEDLGQGRSTVNSGFGDDTEKTEAVKHSDTVSYEIMSIIDFNFELQAFVKLQAPRI